MSRLYSVLRQIFPPPPRFTESDYPDLSGKVCIVTGANTGVGKEVARLLYSKNATVYAAGRSESKTTAAIEEIKTAHEDSTGSIKFLSLDLGDLTTIKNSATAFLTQESRLDLLINNAGVMIPPAGSKTTQGYELMLGTNCVAPFLFTKLLAPTIVATAKTAPQGSVRVVWVSSSAADVASPRGGVPMDNLDYKQDQMRAMAKYGVSKAGNYYHSTEFARRYKSDGVVSVALNPGNLTTELDRHATNPIFVLGRKLTTYIPIYGAYTELFTTLSPEISIENTGCWVVPWGRFDDIRSDLVQGSKPKSEGGSGIAQDFWEWSEEQVKQYL